MFFAAKGNYQLEQVREQIEKNRMQMDSLAKFGTPAFWYLEGRYRESLGSLAGQPPADEQLQSLKDLSVIMYGLITDDFYGRSHGQTPDPVVLRSLVEYYVMDMILASALFPCSESNAAPLRRLLYRSDWQGISGESTFFLNSVEEALRLEYPRVQGAANLIAAEWVEQSFRKAPEGSDKMELLRTRCLEYADRATVSLNHIYSKSIAYYLMAKHLQGSNPDEAWQYFKKCNELDVDTAAEKSTYFGEDYKSEIYFIEAVNYLKPYFSHLFEQGRYEEIIGTGDYLLGHRLSTPYQHSIADRVIFWGQRARNVLTAAMEYDEASRLEDRLEPYYELIGRKQAGDEDSNTATPED
jgi:hypothetical protein